MNRYRCESCRIYIHAYVIVTLGGEEFRVCYDCAFVVDGGEAQARERYQGPIRFRGRIAPVSW